MVECELTSHTHHPGSWHPREVGIPLGLAKLVRGQVGILTRARKFVLIEWAYSEISIPPCTRRVGSSQLPGGQVRRQPAHTAPCGIAGSRAAQLGAAHTPGPGWRSEGEQGPGADRLAAGSFYPSKPGRVRSPEVTICDLKIVVPRQ